MYFIEYIIKKLTQKNEKPAYIPPGNEELDDNESCEHIFMPVDSTGETLSCTNCGILIAKDELEKHMSKNFFVKK